MGGKHLPGGGAEGGVPLRLLAPSLGTQVRKRLHQLPRGGAEGGVLRHAPRVHLRHLGGTLAGDKQGAELTPRRALPGQQLLECVCVCGGGGVRVRA